MVWFRVRWWLQWTRFPVRSYFTLIICNRLRGWMAWIYYRVAEGFQQRFLWRHKGNRWSSSRPARRSWPTPFVAPASALSGATPTENHGVCILIETTVPLMHVPCAWFLKDVLCSDKKNNQSDWLINLKDRWTISKQVAKIVFFPVLFYKCWIRSVRFNYTILQEMNFAGFVHLVIIFFLELAPNNAAKIKSDKDKTPLEQSVP